MDASSLLTLPTSPAASGLQIFALFINFFFPALALFIVSVRVAGRLASGLFAVDDWLVCIAMLMSVAETVISFFFIKTNFVGIEPEDVPPHDPTQGLIWAYAVQILYNPILALVKSSILIFLIRLFGQRKWVRRFLVWLNVINISQMVGVFFAILLQCTPISLNWDPTVSGGYCVDRRILYISTSAFNIVTDVLILGLPLWIFSSLKIPKRAKTALLIIFLLGFLVTITSIVRLILLVQGLFNIPIFPNSASNVGFVSSAIETNLALITASAPALRPIFRSRDRGGWFARSVMATTRVPDGNNNNKTATTATNSYPDLEMGQKPVGWEKETSPGMGSSGVNTGAGASKFGRGGSRGGRKGSVTRGSSRTGGRGGSKTGTSRGWRAGSSSSKKKTRPTITLIRTTAAAASASATTRERGALTELRSSPRPGEEQAMTSNGIVRVSDIQREIDGIVKDIAVAGAGSYTGGSSPSTLNPVTQQQQQRQPKGEDQTPDLRAPKTPKTPRTPKTPKTPPRPRPSMETITVGATLVTPLPPRPSTSGSVARRAPPERYYSASIYPDRDGSGGDGYGVDDYDDDEYGDDDRVSRYLDRRFGVVTPKGTTPTSRGWEGSGRPF
ncbi:hypothetical protein P885DRAFT_73471 [Corynascus similis CBS 632.67]